MQARRGSGQSHPSLYAHETMLLASCKRGDTVWMAQSLELLQGRFPEQAATASTRSLLLKGCAVAADPAEALRYLRAQPEATVTMTDCELVMGSISTLDSYRFISAAATASCGSCWRLSRCSSAY